MDVDRVTTYCIINCSKNINGFNSITFTDTEQRFGVVVAESHHQHKLWALKQITWQLFETLACKAAEDMHSLKECYFSSLFCLLLNQSCFVYVVTGRIMCFALEGYIVMNCLYRGAQFQLKCCYIFLCQQVYFAWSKSFKGFNIFNFC